MMAMTTDRGTRLRFCLMAVAALLLGGCGDDGTTLPVRGVPATAEVRAGQDQQGAVGAMLPQPLVVRVLDASGRPVPDQVVGFAVTAGGGALYVASVQTDANGDAVNRWTLGTAAADSQRVEVRVVEPGTGTPLVLATFRATARPAAGATLEGVPPAAFAAYAAASTTVFVRVRDRFGNPAPGATVRWRVVDGGGSVAPATSVTDAAGVASATWTQGTRVGTPARLEASLDGAQPVFFTAAPETPVNVVVTPVGAGQSAQVLTQLPNPVGVRVTLPDGRPLAGVPVSFFAPQDASFIVPADSVTDAQGFARAAWTMPPRAGTYTLQVRVGSPNQLNFTAIQATATAGPPTRLERIVESSQCTVAGGVVTPPIGLRLRDAYLNPVPGVRVEFSVPGDGYITPEFLLTDADGAVRPQWTVRTTPGRDTLYASIPAMNHTELFLVDVCPRPAPVPRLDGASAWGATPRQAVRGTSGVRARRRDASGRAPASARGGSGEVQVPSRAGIGGTSAPAAG
jgi:hypothetical protein